MDKPVEPKSFQLPLELQFSMRKAELHAKEMTWDQLQLALLRLYHQRLMEWHALKSLMADENVNIDFDVPTDIELTQLGVRHSEEFEDDIDDDEDNEDFLTA
tara:strand:+ start:2234 stop:2539 length:306 start_codon:yes stop_codon:yes gene_type:complete